MRPQNAAVMLGVCAWLATSTTQADPARFELVARGATAGVAVGMSRAGYTLMGDLGGESNGIRSFDERRWLLQWDVLLAARGGELANEDPYLSMFGARALAWIEPVRRLLARAWSPAVSARLGADAQILWHPGVSLGELHDLNDMSGVGGVNARGLVRTGGGASYLDATRSLLIQAFVQERLQSHTINQDGLAFTQIGFSARVDWTWGVQASIEAAWGVTPSAHHPALGLTDRTTRLGFDATARKIFSNGMWIGLFLSMDRDTNHLVYAGTNTTFDTANPVNFAGGASFGVSLWKYGGRSR